MPVKLGEPELGSVLIETRYKGCGWSELAPATCEAGGRHGEKCRSTASSSTFEQLCSKTGALFYHPLLFSSSFDPDFDWDYSSRFFEFSLFGFPSLQQGKKRRSTMVCTQLHQPWHSCLFCRDCIDTYNLAMSKRASAPTPPSDDRTRRANFGPIGFTEACKNLGEEFEMVSATKPAKLKEPIEGVEKSPISRVVDSPAVPGASSTLLLCCSDLG